MVNEILNFAVLHSFGRDPEICRNRISEGLGDIHGLTYSRNPLVVVADNTSWCSVCRVSRQDTLKAAAVGKVILPTSSVSPPGLNVSITPGDAHSDKSNSSRDTRDESARWHLIIANQIDFRP